MAETHTIARRLQWAKKSPEERAEIMSKVARAKHQKMTPEQRKKHSDMMNEIKRNKQKNG